MMHMHYGYSLANHSPYHLSFLTMVDINPLKSRLLQKNNNLPSKKHEGRLIQPHRTEGKQTGSQ